MARAETSSAARAGIVGTARGRDAITRGLLAIGYGDAAAARANAKVARRLVSHDPLALLLHAQSAQLDGDADRAQRAFRTMAERADTRLLGLRGLFIEAQRADDPAAAVAIAEEALKTSPSSIWASQAALGFRCARGDWAGALAILDRNVASGRIDKALYRRQRGVLLTARALELEKSDRDLSRRYVMEAVKFAPTLMPAVVLASKYLSEANQMRRAMRIIEIAWLAQPHPDLADAYAHVMPGRFGAAAVGAGRDASGKSAWSSGKRAGDRARGDRCQRIRPGARCSGAADRSADAARCDVDGRNRAQRAWRQRARPRLDVASRTRPARSGLDRRRVRVGPLASGFAGNRAA